MICKRNPDTFEFVLVTYVLCAAMKCTLFWMIKIGTGSANERVPVPLCISVWLNEFNNLPYTSFFATSSLPCSCRVRFLSIPQLNMILQIKRVAPDLMLGSAASRPCPSPPKRCLVTSWNYCYCWHGKHDGIRIHDLPSMTSSLQMRRWRLPLNPMVHSHIVRGGLSSQSWRLTPPRCSRPHHLEWQLNNSESGEQVQNVSPVFADFCVVIDFTLDRFLVCVSKNVGEKMHPFEIHCSVNYTFTVVRHMVDHPLRNEQYLSCWKCFVLDMVQMTGIVSRLFSAFEIVPCISELFSRQPQNVCLAVLVVSSFGCVHDHSVVPELVNRKWIRSVFLQQLDMLRLSIFYERSRLALAHQRDAPQFKKTPINTFMLWYNCGIWTISSTK